MAKFGLVVGNREKVQNARLNIEDVFAIFTYYR